MRKSNTFRGDFKVEDISVSGKKIKNIDGYEVPLNEQTKPIYQFLIERGQELCISH